MAGETPMEDSRKPGTEGGPIPYDTVLSLVQARTIAIPYSLGKAAQKLELPVSSGRYKIEKELGRGGMGVVYLAEDPNLERKVAIKVFPYEPEPGATADETEELKGQHREMTQRFIREAKLTALEHPNIVRIYDFVTLEHESKIYYAMIEEFVRGTDMSKVLLEIKDKPHARNEWPRRALLNVFRAAAYGLAYAHDQGVVHRDIKPANIMVVPEYNVTKVMDWGLAKVRGLPDATREKLLRKIEEIKKSKEATANLTLPGYAMGTPLYMSPEMAKGDIDEVDNRSDVFSLGAMLYEFLTGVPPFQGISSYEILSKVTTEEPLDPNKRLEQIPDSQRIASAVPPTLKEITLQCLQKGKKDRYQDVHSLIKDLDKYFAGVHTALVEKLAEKETKAYRREDAISILSDAIEENLAEIAERKRGDLPVTDQQLLVADLYFRKAVEEAKLGQTKAIVASYDKALEILTEPLGKIESEVEKSLLGKFAQFYLAEDWASAERAAEDMKIYGYRLGSKPIQARGYVCVAKALNRKCGKTKDKADIRKALAVLDEAEQKFEDADLRTSIILERAYTAASAANYLEGASSGCMPFIAAWLDKRYCSKMLAIAEESARKVQSIAGNEEKKADATNVIGFVEYKRGNYDSAMEIFRSNEKTAREVTKLSRIVALSNTGMGKCLFKKGRLDEARAHFKKAMSSVQAASSDDIRDFLKKEGYNPDEFLE